VTADFVGQIVKLRPIGNRPGLFSLIAEADCQSAAGFHPALHRRFKAAAGGPRKIVAARKEYEG
jgi:hypothetical protein